MLNSILRFKQWSMMINDKIMLEYVTMIYFQRKNCFPIISVFFLIELKMSTGGNDINLIILYFLFFYNSFSHMEHLTHFILC